MTIFARVKGVNLESKIPQHTCNIKHHIDVPCLMIAPCV